MIAAAFGRVLAWAQRHRLTGLRAVWTVSAVLAAIGVGSVVAMRDWGALIPDATFAWWVLIGAFFMVEVFVVHIDVQREAQTISLSEVPLVFGLFLVSPVQLIAAQAIGAAIALLVYRRQGPVKLVFNVAQFSVVTATAIGVFRLFAMPFDAAGPGAWMAAAVAVLVADLVAASLLSIVMMLVEGQSALPSIRHFVGFGTITALANTALGVLGVTLLQDAPEAALLLLVPIGITVAAYRGYWNEHRRSEHLQFLYESMRALSAAPDLEQSVLRLLNDARQVFDADIAVAVIAPHDEREPWRRSTAGPGHAEESLVAVGALPDEWPGPDGLLYRARTNGRGYRCRLLDRDVRDALIVPLRGETDVIGYLVVAERRSSINTFTSADLQFLRTFATHAGVALDNRSLKNSIGELSRANDALFQQALHDPLTQLANRTLFHDRVDHALSRRDDGSLVGVLYIDLDDFKDVNDTLGHAAGDRVLTAVAERLRACLRPGDTAARLGGDEFAVLLYDLAHRSEADAVCERILGALRAPVSAGEQEVRVRASVGVSVVPIGTMTSDVIGQADEAMYDAKRSGKGRWVMHDVA